MKEAWAKPEVRIKGSGSNNPQWKGGISFEPYCPKFTRQLKDEIRAAFGYKCYLCPHIQNGKKLCIHHVDYDKNDICNGKKWPLIPLCHKCHGKTNHNRWYWFNLLMNYWAMNPEINFMEACWMEIFSSSKAAKELGPIIASHPSSSCRVEAVEILGHYRGLGDHPGPTSWFGRSWGLSGHSPGLQQDEVSLRLDLWHFWID